VLAMLSRYLAEGMDVATAINLAGRGARCGRQQD